jgi:hypothetical protein
MRDNNFKEQLSYFKFKDRKVHKMSKRMVHVLSNFRTAILSCVIKD